VQWLVASLAAVVVAVAVLLLWRLRRARARIGRKLRRPAEQLRYPLVLAHGLAGFDQISVAGVKRDYFRGVPVKLTSMGAKVHVPRVSPFAAVAERAKQLSEAVNALDAEKVNLIAHSLGGLDARYAISKLGLAKKVAALVTIGTPHRGTPVADLGTSLAGKLGVRAMLSGLGFEADALFTLTTERMLHFNAEVSDAGGVWYGSMLCAAEESVNPLLIATHLLLKKRTGKNDGLVPCDSQRWGEVLAEFDADHWAQIGWSERFDAPALYVRVVDELKARGF
jgi:triacylglycerol lipase